MTFQQLFALIESRIGKLDSSAFGPEPVAYEFVLTGEGGGTFCALIQDGRLTVEPYEYQNNNCRLTMRSTDFLRLLEGRLNPVVAFSLGKLKVDGDMGKALLLSDIIKKTS